MKRYVISYKDLDPAFVESENKAIRAEIEAENDELKRLGKPLFPIFTHASIHGILMSIVLLCFGVEFDKVFDLFVFQLLSHFAIDTLKGKMNVWFPSLTNPANKFHWYVFGFDQYLHALIIICITYLCGGFVF